MQYSDDSEFGREVPSDDDFERDELGFTTEEGSSMFSRAGTSIESMSIKEITKSKHSKA